MAISVSICKGGALVGVLMSCAILAAQEKRAPPTSVNRRLSFTRQSNSEILEVLTRYAGVSASEVLLRNCNFGKQVPATCLRSPSVTSLVLDSNVMEFDFESLAEDASQSKIGRFSIIAKKTPVGLFNCLSQMPCLERLHLETSERDDSVLSVARRLPKICDLGLAGKCCSDGVMQSLEDAKRLEILRLTHGRNVSRSAFRAIANLQKLEILYVKFPPRTVEVMLPLTQSSSLRKIFVERGSGSFNAGLATAWEASGSEISLYFCGS